MFPQIAPEVAAFHDVYLARLASEHAGSSTLKLRRTVLRRLAVHPLTATEDDFARVTEGVTDRTTRSVYLSQLKYAYLDFVRYGWLERNPAAWIKPPKVPRRSPRPLPPDELRLLLSQPDRLCRAWSVLGYRAGLRISEVAGLRGDALEAGVHGWQLRVVGKGDLDAVVPAHPEVVAVFEEFRRGDGRMWPHTSKSLGRRWKQHAVALGLPPSRTFHQLRHSAGTSLYQATGGDLLTVARVMRHASVATTQRYAAVADDAAFRAVAGMR